MYIKQLIHKKTYIDQIKMLLNFILGLFLVMVWNPSAQTLSDWPDCYYVEGILSLPYAEIAESFTAFYESKKNRSRVDYYDLVQTYQFGSTGDGDFGYSLKVAPMTTEKFLNVKHCFQVNGTADTGAVTLQSLLPNTNGFEFIGTADINGINCSVWQNTSKIGGKKNSYTFYESVNSKQPVRYEMIGYDTLLGSHYDRYYVDYLIYSTQKSFDDVIFQVPANLTCGGFPGPGLDDHLITMNPMHEYIHHDDSHVEDLFHRFKKNHGKNYKDHIEHDHRKDVFRNNVRYIHSKNRAGLGFTLAVNHLADLNDDEMKMMRGRKHSIGYNGGLPFDKTQFDPNNVPDQIDWRLYGAVTPVKDQAVCGSCWSFGTTGCLEGSYFLKNKNLVRFSQQELIDCSWGEGNDACDGGEDFRAYQWIMKHGLATEEDYGMYLGQDGLCHQKDVKPTAFMKGYVNITSGDSNALKMSISKFGPVSVGIDASHKSLSFYSNGVYYEPQCSSTNLDHAVLAVGYGVLDGEAFWLIKNSWSTYWGNDGYVLMSQKDNDCGVATSATYILM